MFHTLIRSLRVTTSTIATNNNLYTRTLVTGLVGLPNVGKSSLFNALISNLNGAEAANYPFCTIDPNKGIASVIDPTLDALSSVYGSKKKIPAILEFLDIAGLVQGASKGEGLGNKFLGNIRECDAILHVVRCFEDDDIIHVESSVDPIRDLEVINIELALSDLEQVEKKLKNKKISGVERNILENVQNTLEQGLPARSLNYTNDELKFINSLHLLTMKKQLYVANVDDMSLGDGNKYSKMMEKHVANTDDGVVLCSAKFESELVGIEDDNERVEYMEMCGLSSNETGLERLSSSTYDLLGLCHYYTVGPEEARAWTIQTGSTAPVAAGKIHTDIRDGFIRADVVTSKDMINNGSWNACKEKGLVRSEGKDYIVAHGDTMMFHHR